MSRDENLSKSNIDYAFELVQYYVTPSSDGAWNFENVVDNSPIQPDSEGNLEIFLSRFPAKVEFILAEEASNSWELDGLNKEFSFPTMFGGNESCGSVVPTGSTITFNFEVPFEGEAQQYNFKIVARNKQTQKVYESQDPTIVLPKPKDENTDS